MRRVALFLIPFGLAACGGSPAPSGIIDTDDALACLPFPSAPNAGSFKPAGTHIPVAQIDNILPPGNSGHFHTNPANCEVGTLCTATAQPPGDYGPHIDDQRVNTRSGSDVHMYWDSQFKDGRFFDTDGQTPVHSLRGGDVVIYRDDYGVPIIIADDNAANDNAADSHGDLWFGAGYAAAEDRLFLLDAAIRQAKGTLAEVLGAGTVPADVQQRVLTYSIAEYQAMFEGLSDDAQEAISQYRDGANAWIARVVAGDEELPAEFQILGYDPTPITVTDIAALGVLMTRFVASAGGDSMANAVALQALEAQHGKAVGRQIFKDTQWLDDKNATTTIPDIEFTNISTPVALRDDVFEAMADYATSLPAELAAGPGTGDFPEPSIAKMKLPEGYKWQVDPNLLAEAVERNIPKSTTISASYMSVISPDLTADGSTLLINGPQLGYTYPTLLYEFEIHGGGHNSRGVSVPGLPVQGIGYGERLAWGLTTGESKTIDSFIEEVVDPANNTYRHNGEVKTMECRTEVVNYRQSDANTGAPVPGSAPDSGGSENIEVCRTVHGPVVATSNDGTLARTVQYAMWNREVETIEGVLAWSRARNATEFEAAMAQVTWNENTMYADADGNIAYYHPGLHHWRHPTVDQRFPIKGDGSQDMCGILPFANTPKIRNPARGWVTNWNNKPVRGWGDNSGGDASQLPGGEDGRNKVWEDILASEANGATYANLGEFDRKIGRVDPKSAALLSPILACDNNSDCGLSPDEQALIDILKTWDEQHYTEGLSLDDDQATDDPAPTIFSAIVDAMVSDITEGVLPEDYITRHNRRGNHPYDAGTFHKLIAKIIQPSKSSIPVQYDWFGGRSNEQFVSDSITTALAAMTAEYGGSDPTTFRRVHARSSVAALAAPLAGPDITMPHQDRGSWIHMVGYPAAP